MNENEIKSLRHKIRKGPSDQLLSIKPFAAGMYDFVMGATIVAEMGMFNESQDVKNLKKGLEWFRENNNKAYMTLLD